MIKPIIVILIRFEGVQVKDIMDHIGRNVSMIILCQFKFWNQVGATQNENSGIFNFKGFKGGL